MSNDTASPRDLTVRDLSTVTKVVEFLDEALGDEFAGYASRYGEPGYDQPSGQTPLVVLGNYWCRCDGELHDKLATHYPAEHLILEEQGVEFEWYDEWTVVHEEDAAYRCSPDSYSWTPSVVLDDDGTWLTPLSDPQFWIDWAVNDPHRAIPANVLQNGLHHFGFDQWGNGYVNGWHPGQDDDPVAVDKAIRKQALQYHGVESTDVDVVFVLSEQSQFDTHFQAWRRLPEREEDEDE